MNPKYEIIWTNVAENDLKEIIYYISIDSHQKALAVLTPINGISKFTKLFPVGKKQEIISNLLKNIKQSASNLYTLPEKGRIVPELQAQGILQYRELIIPPWRLVYRIDERKIYVLSVIDSRRNVEDILLSRLVGK